MHRAQKQQQQRPTAEQHLQNQNTKRKYERNWRTLTTTYPVQGKKHRQPILFMKMQ